jgi:uncharacterized protein YegL
MTTHTNNHTNGTAAAEPMTVAIVLDKSGSMEPLREAVVEAYSRFLGELAEDGGELRVSLTSFDTSFDHLYTAQPLAAVQPLGYGDYLPGGMTALFDAIAHTTMETERQLQAAGRDGEKVLVAVITDGEENSSTDYDAATLAELIAHYEERGNWTFVYLGAQASLVDAQRVSAGFGIKSGNAMRWGATVDSTRATMDSLAAATKTRRRAAGRRSDNVFADAGQSEADYDPGNDATSAPARPPRKTTRSQRPFKQRSLRDELDQLTNDSRRS